MTEKRRQRVSVELVQYSVVETLIKGVWVEDGTDVVVDLVLGAGVVRTWDSEIVWEGGVGTERRTNEQYDEKKETMLGHFADAVVNLSERACGHDELACNLDEDEAQQA